MKKIIVMLSAVAMASGTGAETPQDEATPSETTRLDTGERDQLRLKSTAITGNKELPKVLYIVPWKKAESLDDPGLPARSLIDEILAPVDRSEFRRTLAIHKQLTARAVKTDTPTELSSEDSEQE